VRFVSGESRKGNLVETAREGARLGALRAVRRGGAAVDGCQVENSVGAEAERAPSGRRGEWDACEWSLWSLVPMRVGKWK